MKKIMLLACSSLLALTLTAQTQKPKPKPKSQAPAKSQAPTKSQAPASQEMEALLKEAQQAINDLDPEEKKMMDSMGIKMPSFNNVPKLTDQQLAQAYEEDGKLVPAKKTALINAMPKVILSNDALTAYVKNTNTSIAALIKPQSKVLTEKAMTQFKNDRYYGAMIAATANGMWMMGLKEPAVYLMGKAVEALPNADNYNNYAAYLTMTGAAHIAIPVLQKLNSIHHRNSTIYNNLGQAWLQLGEPEKGERYLDSAILIYANHPQANYTKCLLLESRGQIAEAAIALRKSLKHSVTKTKLDKLKSLEKKKSGSKYYLAMTYYSTSFDLGAYAALLPSSYTFTVGMDIEEDWIFARQQLSEVEAGLDAAIQKASEREANELGLLQQKLSNGRSMGFSPYYYRAISLAGSQLDAAYQFEVEKQTRSDVEYAKKWAALKQEYEEAIRQEAERFGKLVADGANLQDNCAGETPIRNRYIKAINDLNIDFRNKKMKEWTTEAYQQYDIIRATAPSAGSALKAILQLKKDYVSKLKGLPHEYFGAQQCIPPGPPKTRKQKGLPDYDKVNCQMKSTLYVPLTGQITIRCNQMDVEFNPTYLPVKGSWTENFNTNRIEEASVGITVKAVDLEVAGKFDEEGNLESGKVSVGKNIKGLDVKVNGEFDASGFTKGSVDLGIDGSLSLLPKSITDAAPVDISLKGELGVGLELGPEGITDMYVKEGHSLDMSATMEAEFAETGAETEGLINQVLKGADVQLDAPKVTTGATMSADNRWGVNSGYSASSSNELSSLTVK
jgi:Tfp pilus assembly protein PilF/protein-tyrosine-phosphatase